MPNLATWRKFFSFFFSCVNDYIHNMVTFTALVKINSMKQAELGKIFVQQKFSAIWYFEFQRVIFIRCILHRGTLQI